MADLTQPELTAAIAAVKAKIAAASIPRFAKALITDDEITILVIAALDAAAAVRAQQA